MLLRYSAWVQFSNSFCSFEYSPFIILRMLTTPISVKVHKADSTQHTHISSKRVTKSLGRSRDNWRKQVINILFVPSISDLHKRIRLVHPFSKSSQTRFNTAWSVIAWQGWPDPERDNANRSVLHKRAYKQAIYNRDTPVSGTRFLFGMCRFSHSERRLSVCFWSCVAADTDFKSCMEVGVGLCK